MKKLLGMVLSGIMLVTSVSTSVFAQEIVHNNGAKTHFNRLHMANTNDLFSITIERPTGEVETFRFNDVFGDKPYIVKHDAIIIEDGSLFMSEEDIAYFKEFGFNSLFENTTHVIEHDAIINTDSNLFLSEQYVYEDIEAHSTWVIPGGSVVRSTRSTTLFPGDRISYTIVPQFAPNLQVGVWNHGNSTFNSAHTVTGGAGNIPSSNSFVMNANGIFSFAISNRASTTNNVLVNYSISW